MDDRTSVFVDAVQATRERMYRVAQDDAAHGCGRGGRGIHGDDDCLETAAALRNLDALPAYLTRCTVNAARAMLRRRKRETLMDAAHLPERRRKAARIHPCGCTCSDCRKNTGCRWRCDMERIYR